MGFINRHKSEEKKDAPLPPPPPGAPASAPSAPAGAPPNIAPPEAKVEDVGSLSSPPVPGGNLEDIKNQVISSSEGSVSSNSEMAAAASPMPSLNSSVSEDSSVTEHHDSDLGSSDDDSLFDFSSLDIDQSELEPSSSDVESSSGGALEIEDKSESANAEVSKDLNFISNKSLNSNSNLNMDSFFVTTSQFKMFLEIIESVKERVKSSSETHLRLLDIKSEEDIEYENLRKDFQFIEDKLYEVDNLLFNR